MIFPCWQEIGQSTHRLAQACSSILREPATHTGTLDPMASGVVVVLTGEDRFAKGQLTDWNKDYSFSILWGISTDSLDLLGLITDISPDRPTIDQVLDTLTRFPHTYRQSSPAFSAQRIQGGSGFDLARVGRAFARKTRTVQIASLSLEAQSVITSHDLLVLQHERLSTLPGSFRQRAILGNWEQTLQRAHPYWHITHHCATVSTGTYIRQLVADIAQAVAIPAVTFAITRTRNGPYQQNDCCSLDELASIVENEV